MPEPSIRPSASTGLQVDASVEDAGHGKMEVAGRRGRLIHGWSANLVQMLLGLSQQLLLFPAFLHFWFGKTSPAWLAIYAAGSLVACPKMPACRCAINRLLGFRSCGCERAARAPAAR
ncbi:hypothetical protein [Bradyrhizobium canariense]|uniref:Uncharacterized protein n=1 Tax=Bradyrhizobium canariense TaxID=255045 RepID=A0A1X3FSQ6_9BRAD|nr:hypothetical protein [Bradyrhizobium canariense]OSI69472.1 hypothetical protein BSZ22_17940 [Bradyrhizobium canariense]OSI78269.1 hypothetical protein BSZ23_18935 [Bradyrhizobium canariense]OSI90229.1 hypothetical protein BSZ25_18565 [Bradyrhizobium canariense]OSI93578.1 hypothetical protein BSZ24_12850 [Bradyrhizobium canariense]OSJ03555.1 hypothetical protein BSZ16_15825 [Bradyrhizobium canariense]